MVLERGSALKPVCQSQRVRRDSVVAVVVAAVAVAVVVVAAVAVVLAVAASVD